MRDCLRRLGQAVSALSSSRARVKSLAHASQVGRLNPPVHVFLLIERYNKYIPFNINLIQLYQSLLIAMAAKMSGRPIAELQCQPPSSLTIWASCKCCHPPVYYPFRVILPVGRALHLQGECLCSHWFPAGRTSPAPGKGRRAGLVRGRHKPYARNSQNRPYQILRAQR